MLPVGGPNTGNGHQELKARVIGWIRDELHAAAQGGIGLHVDGATGNLIIDQGEVQSGNYVAGTSGWALQPTGNAEFAGTVNVDGTLNVTGDAEFSGAVTIDGSLTIASGLLQGITYVEAGQAGLTTTNFAVSTTPAAVASTTITVPAGFTTALVFSSAHVFAYNPTASGEYLYVGSEIAPTTPAFIPTEVGPTSWATAHGSSSRIVTGLSGGTIGVAAIAHSNTAAWAAQTANIATIDAIALFIR